VAGESDGWWSLHGLGAYSAQRGAEAKSPSTLQHAHRRRGACTSRPEGVNSPPAATETVLKTDLAMNCLMIGNCYGWLPSSRVGSN
jgi:hypothetical protein